jgi:hypothetical protein
MQPRVRRDLTLRGLLGVTWFTGSRRVVRYQRDEIGGPLMAAIARILSRAFPETQFEVETLKIIMIFCGAGLMVSLLFLTYSLDLSAGFF